MAVMPYVISPFMKGLVALSTKARLSFKKTQDTL